MRLSWHRNKDWHRWFAWRPVAIGDLVFWLEWVECRWNPNVNLVAIHPDDRGEYAGAWEYRNV